jgi:hypothetical protein
MFSELNKAGLLQRAGLAHRSEFPPAIPRRVAPQQSPLPLAGAKTLHPQSNLLQSRRRQSVSPFNCLSHGVHSSKLSP